MEKAFLRCLIRDHDKKRFQERHEYVEKCVAALNEKYGEGTVESSYTGKYSSMYDAIMKVPYMIDYAKQAMADCGVEMHAIPMRGGTDGARLSFKGLPCPNIFTGGHNFHGIYEYLPVQSVEKSCETVVEIISSAGQLKRQ